jgi:hypothetical protein
MRTKNTEKSEHASLTRIPELIMRRILKTGLRQSKPVKTVPLYLTKRLLFMSPRRAQAPEKSGTTPRLKAGPSKNRERHLEDTRHHPSDHPLPHSPHKTIKKPVLPPKHTPHSHPHGDELPPHTNPPGPIKPSKKMTKSGSRS